MNFREQVFHLTKQIPAGKVVSYGQIALALGNPRAARQVGWALASLSVSPDKSVPWWRVVNKDGYLSIKGYEPDAKNIQRELLIEEGIEVGEDLTVNMAIYRFGF